MPPEAFHSDLDCEEKLRRLYANGVLSFSQALTLLGVGEQAETTRPTAWDLLMGEDSF